jgi:hypothetical protein
MGQLLKVPILITHFLEHKQLDQMSFGEYLVHHYGGHEKDADWETDMTLPFMKHGETLNILLLEPSPIVSLLKKALLFNNKGLLNVHQKEDFVSSYLSSIWQPPKFC